MGMSLKVLPGVRIRLSSRGMRVSGGPRAARVHVGGGRSGVSTGFGPFGAYTSLTPKKRRSSSSGSTGSRASSSATSGGSGSAAAPTSVFSTEDAAVMESAEAIAAFGAQGATAMAELGRQALDARRQETANKALQREQARAEAERVVAAFQAQMLAMATTHHETFDPVTAQTMWVDEDAIRALHVDAAKAATAGVHVGKRKEAVAEANRRADVEIANARAFLAARWNALVANDPMTVVEVLDEAFEDNQSPAVAVGCEDDHVTVIVTVPGAVPETRPELTDRGKLTNKPWQPAEAAAFHLLVIASAILATIKEAWATAPSINAITIVALAQTQQFGIEGLTATSVLYQGTFTRDRHERLAWTHIDPVDEITRADDVLLVRKGRAKAIQPLPLDKHPDLRELINQTEAAWEHEPEPATSAAPQESPAPPATPPANTATSANETLAGSTPVTAGWFDDPWDNGNTESRQLRWWDGNQWTGHLSAPPRGR